MDVKLRTIFQDMTPRWRQQSHAAMASRTQREAVHRTYLHFLLQSVEQDLPQQMSCDERVQCPPQITGKSALHGLTMMRMPCLKKISKKFLSTWYQCSVSPPCTHDVVRPAAGELRRKTRQGSRGIAPADALRRAAQY
eukprot:SAG31_NODE_1047_length_10174_cov_3.130819_6_plen_138_part_00